MGQSEAVFPINPVMPPLEAEGRPLPLDLGPCSRPRRGNPSALSRKALGVPRHGMFRLGLGTVLCQRAF